MAKSPPMRVALDLETTGLHAEQDAILEVAAIKFRGEEVIATLDTLVDPGRPIPYRVQRLTGITPKHVTNAPRFEAIARQVEDFIGDFPIVGHSIPFDVSFLRRRGLARSNPLIDTFELATVILPSLPSYNLGQVAAALGVTVAPGRHRAMVDTVLAMHVFLALHQRLRAVDLSLLKDLANLDAPRTWPLLGFLRQELRDRQEQDGLSGVSLRGSFGDRFAAQLGMDPRILSFAIARQNTDTSSSVVHASEGTVLLHKQTVQVAPPLLEQVQTLVEGDVEQEKPIQHMGYQAASKAVRVALEQSASLLMEVTVGANGYTPVLLPALEWLIQPPAHEDASIRRLVIACANQQSARRLIESVLPRLQAMCKSNVPVAYLAEREGYLCVHRWFGSALRRTSGELSAEQARGLAKLGLWAQQTLTGERSELTLLPQEIAAWERICSGVERMPLAGARASTPYEQCLYRRNGYCFVRRAEERVQAATIVVTTHAGLFDDLTHEHSLLAPIDRRVLLDADLLEDEIARWSSAELDAHHLQAMLNTIGTELPDGRYQGLLALAAPALRENGPGGLSLTHTVAKAELDTRLLSWFQALRQSRTALDKFFTTLRNLLEEFQQQGANGNGRDKGKGEPAGRAHAGHGSRTAERADQPLRLMGQTRNMTGWMEVEHAWQQLSQRLQVVVDLVYEAEKSMLTAPRGRHHLERGSGEETPVAWEFAALAQSLLAQKQLGREAFSPTAGGEGENVYWLRMPPPPPPFVQQMAQQRQHEPATPSAEHFPILYTQLVHAAPLLKRHICSPGASAIFAGVALSVDSNFSYYRGRYGLDSCPAYSVVTEHHEQTLLYLPNDVPEPNMPQFQRHLDEAIVQLATTLEGQLVVLCTSHAALRSSYTAVKPLLEARGILALGHGIDGSPRQLWQLFAEQERIVLFGTGPFWDGLDEISRTPACVVISRLPMPVLNDPPMAARVEHYSDQLHHVTVPIAALKVRRALNRLAWSGTKRNAVVLFDRRILSKEYGATVLHTLPHCSQRQETVSHMPEIVLDWLTATGSWE